MIICGYILLYLLLAYIILSKTNTTLGGMAAASQYCHPTIMTTTAEAKGMTNACMRPDLMAFQIVSFIDSSYLGLLGTYTFFLSSKRRHPRYCSSTPIGQCFGSPPEANCINAAIVIFQGWDFIMTYIYLQMNIIHKKILCLHIMQ